MPDIDIGKIVADSIDAAKTQLGNTWNSFKPYAEHEFKQFTENTEHLAQLRLSGTIDDAELKSRLEYQRLALKNVLLTIQGIGLVAAQNVINAVLAVVYKAVGTAVGIALPV